MKRPILVFDIETQRLFEEIKGGRTADLKLACAVVQEFESGAKHVFCVMHGDGTEQARELHRLLSTASLIVGFNHERFDFRVLEGYGVSFKGFPSFDLMLDIEKRAKRKHGLDAVCRATLGKGKKGEGAMAPHLWRQGRFDELVTYCMGDVELTSELFLHGLTYGRVAVSTGPGPRWVHAPWKGEPQVARALVYENEPPK